MIARCCSGELSSDQVQELTEKCQKRLDDFLEQRGDSVFRHRDKTTGAISGTLRYEILKAAGFRCELCGISADEKALQVDHILPRNHGGSDDLSNLRLAAPLCLGSMPGLSISTGFLSRHPALGRVFWPQQSQNRDTARQARQNRCHFWFRTDH
jgi:5-methylcytosine-specific restriction endonuclease McrA